MGFQQYFTPKDSVSLDEIKTNSKFDLISLYAQHEDMDDFTDMDSTFQFGNGSCAYYEPDEVYTQAIDVKDPLSCFHMNCRGLSANWESFRNLLCISVFIHHVFESLFIEIVNNTEWNFIFGVIYRPNTEPHADMDIFSSNMEDIMDTIKKGNLPCVISGDFNVDLLRFKTHAKTNAFLDGICSHGFLPIISKPTRVTTSSATLIDHMYTNLITSSYHSGIIITDVADHFGTFCLLQGKSKQTKPASTKYRSFSPENLSKFRNLLTDINFENIMNIDCPNLAYNEFLKL